MNTTRGFSLATIRPSVNAPFLCVLATLLSNVAYGDCTPAGTIETVQGKVEIHHADSNSWIPGELNSKLCIQDRLKSLEHSRASIRLVNQTLVQLDANTTLTLTAAPSDQKKSVLELLEGLIHTLSRVPRSLEIRTPYVNASIEGTEFVVATSEQQSQVSVIEGKVKTSNANGSVLLGANESATSVQGQAPVRSLQINPLKDVAWEISYLPILEPGESQLTVKGKKAWAHYKTNRPDLALAALKTDSRSDNEFDQLIAAASYLSLGKVESADKMLSRLPPENVPALSLKSIIAIAKNQLDIAKSLIEKTSTLHSDAPEALLAKSYLEQAKKNTSDALVTAKDAHTKYPESTLIASRLSELYLMNGYSQEAEKLAEAITHKHPEDDRALTALGFSQLNNGAAEKSQQSFNKAIQLNSVNSLNHLGLGLSKIKQGNLTEGRSHLETAVLLAPRHSLLRSYLGKAYFEEIRNPLVYDQLMLAKQYDPADPTPWLYEALTLHDDNRAIEALQSMKKSIELNDNRAVYRSQFLLDDDRASRSTALGAIYQALGFEQEAIYPSTQALASNPDSATAHRLLADSYSGDYRTGVARAIELQQAQTHAPLGQKLIPAQLLTSKTPILTNSGPLQGGYNEHNTLFLSDGSYGNLNLTGGGQNTLGGEIAAGYIGKGAALQASVYHLETDGEKSNGDYENNVVTLGLQWQLSPRLQMQLGHSQSTTDKGHNQHRFNEKLGIEGHRTDIEASGGFLSASYRLPHNQRLTGKLFRKTADEVRNFQIFQPSQFTLNPEKTGFLLQHQFQYGKQVTLSGYESTNNDVYSLLTVGGQIRFEDDASNDQNKLYSYFYRPAFNEVVDLTLAAERVHHDATAASDARTEILPKLGLQWHIGPNTQLSLAWFKHLNDVSTHSGQESLIPTQIAGFNQIHNGLEQTLLETIGIAVEHRFTPQLGGGLRLTDSDLTDEQHFDAVPAIGLEEQNIEIKSSEKTGSLWLHWTPSTRWGLSLEYHLDDYEDGFEKALNSTQDNLESVKTDTIPLTLSYHHPAGWSAHWMTQYVKQKGHFWSFPTSPTDPGTQFDATDNFWLTDLSLAYKLPKRTGKLTLGVKNLFAEDYQFEDYSSFDYRQPDSTWVPSNYVRERFWFASVSFHFH